MELPWNLRQIIEEEAEKYPLKRLISASEAVSSAYRKNSANGKSLVSDEAETLAYAAVRMPATYGAAVCALRNTAKLFDGEIDSLLDAGAGCGAFSWAASEVFPELARTVCVEREKNMSKIGGFLMEKGGFPCKYEWRREDLLQTDFPRAELVAVSYVMNELAPAARLNLTQRLWQAAEKMLIVIEPGTPAAFSDLLEIRKLLLSLGAEILAPCPAITDCPLPENDWCHFTARIARSRLHKKLKGGDVPYEDEKYCFLAAVKKSARPCAARILRHPKIESGKITLRLCTSAGILEHTVTKKDGAAFKKARKSDCGDSF